MQRVNMSLNQRFVVFGKGLRFSGVFPDGELEAAVDGVVEPVEPSGEEAYLVGPFADDADVEVFSQCPEAVEEQEGVGVGVDGVEGFVSECAVDFEVEQLLEFADGREGSASPCPVDKDVGDGLWEDAVCPERVPVAGFEDGVPFFGADVFEVVGGGRRQAVFEAEGGEGLEGDAAQGGASGVEGVVGESAFPSTDKIGEVFNAGQLRFL